MASTRLMTRTLLTAAKQTLTSSSRSYASPLFRLRPLSTLPTHFPHPSPLSATIRGFATRPSTSSLNDPNPNWSNRPPKETILLDGCDFEHWLVVVEKPEGDPTRDEIIDSYIKTLATVVGSEEEARMKIYSISTRHYFAFGALVSEELSYKLKELPGVRWVLPDSYLDVKNKDYGGEPFINGQAVPYDPKYHEEWVRNNARANERNRRNDRPRNFDRSRNFERRNMQSNQNSPNPGYNNTGGPQGNNGPNVSIGPQGNMGPNMVGGPQGNMGPNMVRGPQGNVGPNMNGGPQGNMGPNMNGGTQGNMGPNMNGGPQGNMGPNMNGGPQGNMGPNMNGGQQGNMAPNMGPNMARGPQGNMGPNMGGPLPGNVGQQHPAPNFSGGPPVGINTPPNAGIPPQFGGVQSNNIGNPPNYNAGPNIGGYPNNQQNSNYGNGQSNGGAPYQSGPNQNFAPNSGNPYQNQNMPGRDY